MSVGAVGFEIGGMTCASRATPIGRKLNRIEGVEATVNYATENVGGRITRSLSVSQVQMQRIWQYSVCSSASSLFHRVSVPSAASPLRALLASELKT
jgi:cation transport ATPase